MSNESPDELLSETVEIEVPFHDVDLLSIVWHGHYLKYFEIARCALFDRLDYGYERMGESGYSWPVIDVRVRYPQPAKFGDLILVKAKVTEWENRLKVDYEIKNKASGQRLTKGYTIQVAIDLKTNEMCLESPPVLKQRLGV